MTKILGKIIRAFFRSADTEMRDFRDFSYHKVVIAYMPFMFWAKYMTVGNFIFADKSGWRDATDHMNGHLTEPTLMNELIHVLQWKKYGYKFLIMYFIESIICILKLKRPHKHSKYEKESRVYQDEYVKAQYDYKYNVKLSKHLIKHDKG